MQAQFLAVQSGGPQVQPISVVIAGSGGAAGQQQQEALMVAAPHTQQYTAVPGQYRLA